MKQQRERGRYSHTLEKVCTCGHALGQHIAEGPLSQRECVHAGCTCEGFKVKKKLSKFENAFAWYQHLLTRGLSDGLAIHNAARKYGVTVEQLREWIRKPNPAKRGRGKKSTKKLAHPRSGYVVAAQGKGKKMLFDGGKRFTENAPPKTYPTQAAALAAARGLLKRFPRLGRYRVTVESF